MKLFIFKLRDFLPQRLASPAPLAPSIRTPLLLVHGEGDAIMPPAESVRAAEQLTAAGVRASISIEPRLGHQVSTAGLADAASFINYALA
ncbi:prolyl oligopeptidase family serine peptidase [Mesorhizobium sophorae]|uniref:prolyl oligopeptidase family serine peptidase n=1 Tax=Mesorhizobium sophorae TaxID=1300294 RepID=UPI00142D4467